MIRLARIRRALEAWFPERDLYVRSGGQMKAFALSTSKQVALSGVVAGAALWTGVCTAAMLVSLLSTSATDREIAKLKSQSERYVADRQARLDSALARLNANSDSNPSVAQTVERRHAALALLLTDLKGEPGSAEALTPSINRALAADTAPAGRIEMVRVGQEALLKATDNFAKSRIERLRLAFRMAGLTPSSYMDRIAPLGGPLIESSDPAALAAVLDVDEEFASRIQRVALNVSTARALTDAAESMPLARPIEGGAQTSRYGVRADPFTHRPALHSGLDFSASRAELILATGPGVVSFTGVRSGYGKTVEVDHGRGLKTRYAHLSNIAVTRGQRVSIGQRLGTMGSTGRSTGAHLHYEVWVNGRAQNPVRFLRAGRHVLQND